jgi:hypothetical protein
MEKTEEAVKKVERDGHTYIIKQFGAIKGQELALRVSGLLMPVMLSMGMELASKEGVDLQKLKDNPEEALKNLDPSFMGKAIKSLFSNLDPADTSDLILNLMSVVLVKGDKKAIPVSDIYDTHFVKRYGAILFLCQQVIEHNAFLDLLDGVM